MGLLNLFFGYKTGTEYWIPINDVIITYDFQLTSPGRRKFARKLYEFMKFGTLGKIQLNKNFELVDGYCSYLICKMNDMNKIPIWFIDEEGGE